MIVTFIRMKAISTEHILSRLMESYPSLSPQLRRAAQYVLDNPNEVGVNSMRQIAATAEVKPNTLVRLAKSLGFEGYEEFRKPFQDLLRNGVESFPDRARWLQSLAGGGSHSQLFSEMAASSLSNIEQLFLGTSVDEVKAVADLIDQSRRTYIFGVGMGYALAHNFWYVARMALDNLVLVPRHGSLAIDDIVKIGESDVLLAMTFTPYRAEVVEITQFAKRRGARIVAITDSRASPIALVADYVFVTPTNTPQFFTSQVAVTALLESLIAFMVADADQQVVGNIDEFHQARFEAGVYWSEDG